MMNRAFTSINTWIFDLDNTLYPASAGIFDRIDARMGAYISNLLGVDATEARRVQKKYFHEHGTTLSGLIARHETDPHHFLDYVHDIDMSSIAKNPVLSALISQLPGRKLIYTNGDAPYARRILAALGLRDVFDAIYDIHDQAYLPKPAPASYSIMCAALSIDPARAVFVEDMARNLKPAKALGMTTVWVNNGSEAGHFEALSDDGLAHFIDYEIAEPAGWLANILETDA
jgi:putative hydrolase of the HAD superfamily